MADMSQALDEVINHEKRAVLALESMARSFENMADALALWCKLESQRYEKEYPVKVARDAIVTNVPSEEDKLRESLGESDEPLDEWIGLREQEVIKKTK